MLFTILMPCLNEERTVGECVQMAKEYLTSHRIEGEVLVVDNGSEDASVKIAEENGARVCYCEKKGYGNALLQGILQAKGKYVIFADCDCSYDFREMDEFVRLLLGGAQLVVGDRFSAKKMKGAMSFSHRYIGVPFLSLLGRIRYDTNVKDFHCGMRGIHREDFLKLNCSCPGMEFATEMIGRACKAKFIIRQTPVVLYCDKRGHHSHLRSFQDGLRHLKVLVSPLK